MNNETKESKQIERLKLSLRQRALSSANNRQLPISHYIEYHATFRQVATSVDGDSFAIGQLSTGGLQ